MRDSDLQRSGFRISNQGFSSADGPLQYHQQGVAGGFVRADPDRFPGNCAISGFNRATEAELAKCPRVFDYTLGMGVRAGSAKGPTIGTAVFFSDHKVWLILRSILLEKEVEISKLKSLVQDKYGQPDAAGVLSASITFPRGTVMADFWDKSNKEDFNKAAKGTNQPKEQGETEARQQAGSSQVRQSRLGLGGGPPGPAGIRNDVARQAHMRKMAEDDRRAKAGPDAGQAGDSKADREPAWKPQAKDGEKGPKDKGDLKKSFDRAK